MLQAGVENSFSKDLNMAGWRLDGMIPFTHQALWRKVEEFRLLDSSLSLSINPAFVILLA